MQSYYVLQLKVKTEDAPLATAQVARVGVGVHVGGRAGGRARGVAVGVRGARAAGRGCGLRLWAALGLGGG